MDSLIKELNKLSETMLDIANITKKSNSIRLSYGETEVWKKVEEGIINGIINGDASSEQANVIFKNYKFRYHTEFNDNDYFIRYITKMKRDIKINTILK